MIEIINNNYMTLIIIMIFIILLGIIIMLIPMIQKNKKEPNICPLGLNDKEIKKIDDSIDKEQLTKDIFDIYKRIEIAKSKFDYETLKELLTNSLYIDEESKLKELKKNKQRLVATNIKLEELKILSIQNKNNIKLIDCYLHVSEYNYVTNNKKTVIRGTDEAEYQIEYKITLENFKLKKQECIGKWIKNK